MALRISKIDYKTKMLMLKDDGQPSLPSPSMTIREWADWVILTEPATDNLLAPRSSNCLHVGLVVESDCIDENGLFNPRRVK